MLKVFVHQTKFPLSALEVEVKNETISNLFGINEKLLNHFVFDHTNTEKSGIFLLIRGFIFCNGDIEALSQRQSLVR